MNGWRCDFERILLIFVAMSDELRYDTKKQTTFKRFLRR